MGKKLPPIRADEESVSIDMKKGLWPHVTAIRGMRESDEKPVILFICDSNESGQVINEGQGVGIVPLTKRKAAALYAWLGHALDDMP